MKNFTLEIFLKIFLGTSIYVGSLPFHFQKNFPLKIFHGDLQRHNHLDKPARLTIRFVLDLFLMVFAKVKKSTNTETVMLSRVCALERVRLR